jgi:hypothetical protein
MPHTITKTVYLFSELSGPAKERARDWWRHAENADFDTEFAYDDFVECGRIIGIEFDQRPVKLYGGGTRYEPKIYWSGFSSQGDGASFEGRYSYAKQAPANIKRHTGGTDGELIRIATALQEVQRAHGYRLTARMSQGNLSNFYSHSGTMAVEVSDDRDEYRDIGDSDEAIRQLMRDFADWMYRQLEREYEWRMADEQVDDSILANEYEFDESGRRAC